MVDAHAGWQIDRCRPGKVLIGRKSGGTVRYTLHLVRAGETIVTSVGAHLFRTPAAAAAFAQAELLPLLPSVAGRREVRPFRTPAGQLQRSAMVAYAFPLDPDLPTLPAATDPIGMAPLLDAALGVDRSRLQRRARWCVAAERYSRRGRCVVRYTLPSQAIAAYGKISRLEPAPGAMLLAELDGSLDDQVRVPRLLARVDDLHLVVLEALPGHSVDIRVASGVDACAQVAASLHRHQPPANLRTLESLGAALRDDLSDLADRPLADAIETWAGCSLELAAGAEPLAPRLAHGDLTPAQVVVDGPRLGVLDFDEACGSEPAFDLGRLCAYLRIGYRKRIANERAATQAADAACTRFLERYIQLAGVRSRQRADLIRQAAAHEGIALCRLAMHSRQQIKWMRLRHACSILQERFP